MQRVVAARLGVAIVAALVTLAAGGGAAAQTAAYPSRAITLVVPFAAGGPSDAIGRIVAQSMGEKLGQTVVVDNTAGAGGTIGSAKVARAAPDGHTLLLHHIGFSTSVALYKSLPYDPIGDFAPIGMITVVPSVVATKKDLAPTDIGGLLGYLKAKGGQVTVGDAGVGSASQLCHLQLAAALGVGRFEAVSYKGTGPAINDLLSGQYDLLCDLVTIVSTHIKSGGVKGFAVTTKDRVDTLPGLPTLAESGLPGFDMSTWYGLWAPAATPEPILATLVATLKHVLADPTVKARMLPTGSEPLPVSAAEPAVLRGHLKSEIDRWVQVLGAAGVPKN